ncbi:MAG: sulfatase [Acidobacteria bacterium]|nr:sulfatase [Acidobacteriota bacterium]
MGHPWLKTPSLDRLAGGGAIFQNAFVTTSLCSPSRASILTGQYAHAHGVIGNATALNADLPTFPRVLQQNGYTTGLIGKWHMGGSSAMPRPGFDRWISFRGQGTYRDPLLNFDGTERKVDGYVTDILTDEAERFIRQNTTRPFCLYLAHKAVHGEFTPANRHRELYLRDPVPYPKSMANTESNYRGKPDWVRRQRDSVIGVDGMYNHATSFDQFYRDYCRTLMALDESVGRVLNTLEEKRLLDDTLVVYMGDNGFLMGEHGLIDKRAMYEPSIRVPVIAHCPSLFAPGRRRERLALNIDIGPTFLDAAGAPIPGSMQGRSLLPLLTGGQPNPPWRTDFLYEYFWERGLPQVPSLFGLRTERYSYCRYNGIWDVDELYDVSNDPEQVNNLLGDYRITSQIGSVTQRIQDPALRRTVNGFQARIENILLATEGRAEPLWRGR